MMLLSLQMLLLRLTLGGYLLIVLGSLLAEGYGIDKTADFLPFGIIVAVSIEDGGQALLLLGCQFMAVLLLAVVGDEDGLSALGDGQ